MSVRALHSLNPFFLLSPDTAKAPNSSAIPVRVPCQPRRLKPLKCLSQQQQLPQSKSQVQVQEKLPTQADAESPEQEDEKKEEKEEVVEKAIVYGANGIAFKLPGAPFEYQYSYTETPKTKPLKVRERFLPFGPESMKRPWTGKRPQKPSKKKRPELDSFKPPPPGKKGVKPVQAPGPFPPGQRPKIARTREDILGEPLTEEERLDLIKSSIRERRTLQIGRDGLTHNMLDNIHAHWKRRRVCRLKCLGVSTVDMDNICEKLEEKAGGKVIHRQGGVILLFRGRNYNYKTRPVFPLMLWKPKSPVYPKLIQDAPGGLTIEEAAALRKKGHLVPPICTLAKNGVYIELVRDVRHAFEVCELVRINCQKLSASDFKKIGAKLRDLVPCVLLSFEYQHILMWRGKDWKPMETEIKKVSTQTEEYIDADQEPCTSDVSRESNTQSDVKLEGQGLESVSASALEKTNGNSFDVRRDTTAEPGETTINLDNFSQERNRLHQDRFAFSSEEKQEAEKREPNIEKDFLLPPKLHSISDESKIEGQPTILSNAFQNSVSNMNTDEGESINLVTSNDCSSQAASSQHTLTETSTCGNDNRETLAEPSKEVINEMPNDILDGQIVDGQMASPNSESDPERKVRLNLDDLWVKAIESGRLLLLEESDPDPDYVLSKAIAFANNAPPCPAFERKVKAGKDGNRKQKIRRQQKWLQDNENNEATNESSGALRVDELAKLLAS